MADTCIICLGDFVTSHDTTHLAGKVDQDPDSKGKAVAVVADDERIAHLLPCGHNLHDVCLKPWVERANSCPICRAKFNQVEILQHVNGPTIDSYPVQDKVQAPVDHQAAPSTDEDDETVDDHVDPCMVCDVYGDESQLLLCDGCNQSCHVCCAGLDAIPAGAWFCYTCQEDGQLMHDNYVPRPVARSAASRQPRTRQSSDNQTAWARLWRSVASRTGIDLEHPFDDEDVTNLQEQRAQRREFREWERRFQVAARAAGAGAANHFRGIAPKPPSNPESQEEIRAWNAFDKARIVSSDGPSRNRRKRRSRDVSPEHETPAPTERKRKRPRLLPATDADLTDSTAGESSRTVRNTRPRPERIDTSAHNGPTFLQSLLDEVETHAATNSSGVDAFDVNGDYFPYGVDRASENVSPTASGPVSPRAMTPPLRPSSPTLLSSNIEPIYPPPPEFGPNSTIIADSVERARSRQRSYVARQSPGTSPIRPPSSSRPGDNTALPPKRTQSNSPPPQQRASVVSPPPAQTPNARTEAKATSLDLETKTAIQSLVKAALKPVYAATPLTKDQYTEVNRDVSRKLYERIGSSANFDKHRDTWGKVAAEEVERAVQALDSATPPQEPTADNAHGVAVRSPPSTLPVRHAE